MTIQTVDVGALHPERFEEVLPADRYRTLVAAIARGKEILSDRTIWNVNSTAHGGGVAEMLRSLLAYCRGAGLDARWAVIPGTPDFFRLTKRIHNRLHGHEGDHRSLGPQDAEAYRRALAPVAEELASMVRPGDIALVHDPQPAGIVAPLKEAGASVVWRCHVGIDHPNDVARSAWDFLRPFIEPASAFVFSRREYIWDGLDGDRSVVIPPSIDAFSPKNQDLSAQQVQAILAVAGISPEGPHGEPTFERDDGSAGRVDRTAVFYDGGDAPPADARLVVQVSRWDDLKDPVGVIEGFAVTAGDHDGHLVVAGPSAEAVADDPEGVEVLDRSLQAWKAAVPDVRPRIHLACLPMEDSSENAAIVNALQRRAQIVVQKSLAEGFGLTVTEAMWKGRAVIASGVGGINDQIEEGVSGVLLRDPSDLPAYGRAVSSLLADPERAERLGEAARVRARDLFLAPRHLEQYLELFEHLLASGH
jgi:trehalose synthase